MKDSAPQDNLTALPTSKAFNGGFLPKLQFPFLLILWAIVFYPLYPLLIRTWLDHLDNSHGILVPFIAAYFAWGKKDELRSLPTSTSWWGFAVLMLSLGFYLLSYAGGIAVAARLMIVTSLMGLVLFCYGREIFKALAFPLFFLFFMVPVPDTVLGIAALPLQLFATKVSTFLIQVVGIPVFREGNMVYFAQTQLEVAEACSGIRSIMSYTMLSVILAYMLKGSWRKKAILVASAVPLALFANIVRVTGTGILAHFYGDRVARGFLHEFSGLAVFAFGFVLLFSEYLLLSRQKPVDEVPSSS